MFQVWGAPLWSTRSTSTCVTRTCTTAAAPRLPWTRRERTNVRRVRVAAAGARAVGELPNADSTALEAARAAAATLSHCQRRVLTKHGHWYHRCRRQRRSGRRHRIHRGSVHRDHRGSSHSQSGHWASWSRDNPQESPRQKTLPERPPGAPAEVGTVVSAATYTAEAPVALVTTEVIARASISHCRSFHRITAGAATGGHRRVGHQSTVERPLGTKLPLAVAQCDGRCQRQIPPKRPPGSPRQQSRPEGPPQGYHRIVHCGHRLNGH